MKVPWGPEDDKRAEDEGWALFETHGSIRGDRLEIERIDVPEDGSIPKFQYDDDAVAHVYREAMGGSEFHRRALLRTLLPEPDQPIHVHLDCGIVSVELDFPLRIMVNDHDDPDIGPYLCDSRSIGITHFTANDRLKGNDED